MKHNFRNLEIWKRSRRFVSTIYKATSSLPESERYGLTSQIRRAAVSIPSNIAEGCGRDSNKELRQYLNISSGSLCEVETQLLLTSDLEFTQEKDVEIIISELIEIRKMIMSFRKHLQQ